MATLQITIIMIMIMIMKDNTTPKTKVNLSIDMLPIFNKSKVIKILFAKEQKKSQRLTVSETHILTQNQNLIT